MTRRFSVISLLSLAVLALGAGRAAAQIAQSGYRVVVEVKVDEKGAAEDAHIVSTEDISAEHILDQISFQMVHQRKFEVRMKDGQPIKYTATVPFVFPVDGDEGVEANLAPRPSLHGVREEQPVYPAELAAAGVTGGAIVEVIVGEDGAVRNATLLRASHPAFGESAVAAIKQWTFSPAIKDGAAVSSRWRLSIVFQTDVQEPDWKWRIAPRPSLGSYTVMHRTRPLPPEPAPAPGATPPPATGK